MEPVRVLHVVEELGMGGIQSFIMNVYRNINRDRIQFDFLLSTDKVGAFEDEIQSLGGKIYRVTARRKSIWRNKTDLKAFFNEHNEYSCIHCHYSNLSNIMPLVIATRKGIPVRIIHSHSTHLSANPLHKLLHQINKKRIDKYATLFFACSDLAGKWLFEGTNGYKSQILINNGIQIDKYLYNEDIRKEYRKKLGLTDDELVIGNTGRLSQPKNHLFIIEVFNEIIKLNENSRLVLVGDGPEKESINDRIKTLGIENYVTMMGARRDVPQLLQVFDCFLMPSKWEGFPVALIEAETAGVPAFVSDTVTRQAQLNKNVEYLDLNIGAKAWAECIVKGLEKAERIHGASAIIDAGFDIKRTAEQLTKVYLNL